GGPRRPNPRRSRRGDTSTGAVAPGGSGIAVSSARGDRGRASACRGGRRGRVSATRARASCKIRRPFVASCSLLVEARGSRAYPLPSTALACNLLPRERVSLRANDHEGPIMQSKIGRMLVQENIVTSEQLNEALERQRREGGRLVENLVKLNYMQDGDFENFVEAAPPPPASIEETNLGEEFLTDLTLKHMYYAGVVPGYELAQRMRLPFQGVVHPLIRFLKDEKQLEIKKGQGISEGAYHYAL